MNAIWSALRDVHDPEVGLDIVSLGLVYDVSARAHATVVTMTLTSPACPLGDSIVREVKWRLARLPGVPPVEVAVVFEPAWTPERMTDEARAELGLPSAKAREP